MMLGNGTEEAAIPILRNYPRIFQKGLMKTTENLTQENQTLGPCKYEPPDCNVQPC
jgi:hypothetical protein